MAGSLEKSWRKLCLRRKKALGMFHKKTLLTIGLGAAILVAGFFLLCPWAATKPTVGAEFFGYTPDPEDTARFVASLPTPTIASADRRLFRAVKTDTFLYRALAKSYEATYGVPWVPHKQGIGDCFIEGTMVTMADGSVKSIEQIREGEYVMSHKGIPRRVLSTFQKQYTGDLVTIKAKGYAFDVTATADHRFVTYPGIPNRKDSKKRGHVDDQTPVWQPVGDLAVGDRVLISRVNAPEDITIFELDVPSQQVILDEKMGWLLGIYLAEGGLDRYPNGKPNRVTFSCGRHETDIVDGIEYIVNDVFGIDAHIDNLPSKPTVTLVRVGNVAVARLFDELTNGNVYSKSIPACVFSAPLPVKLAVIRGWLDGDGHERIASYNNGCSVMSTGVTASLPLLRDMSRLMLSAGLKPSSRMRCPQEDRAPSGSTYLYGESFLTVFEEHRSEVAGMMSKHGLRKTYRDMVEHGIAAQIDKIERTQVVDHTVYCIEVEEDHSFIANGYGVHNCVSHGFAHACDTSLAVDFIIGKAGGFKTASTEAIYGGSRVEARGVSFGGWSDGSYGGAAAKWLRGWGVVYREPVLNFDLTNYSADLAKNWGAYGCGGKDDGGKLDEIAKGHPVHDVTLVRSFEEAAAAIQSGYPIAVCSGQGFSSTRDSDGFCRAQGSWAHCMSITAVRFGERPGCLIQNSWGNYVSGPKWPEDQPDGSFWADVSVINRMLAGEDSFAVSGVEGFKFRDLKHGDWVQLQPRKTLVRSEPEYALAP